MFHPILLERIKFRSNPPLPDKPTIVADRDENGNYKNTVKYVPGDNHGFFEGVHFDPSSMGLRAQLNLGVQLQRVNFGATENDPTVLMENAVRMDNNISQKINELSQNSSSLSSMETPSSSISSES